MNRTWSTGRWAVLALLAAVFAGCNGPADESSRGSLPTSATGGAGPAASSRPKLLFISNSNSDWWNAVEKGMQDGGKAFACDVELRRNNGEVQGQVDRLKEAMSIPGLQGVAVSVLEADAPGIADAMRDLKRSGKVVIAVDSDIAPERADLRSGYIGTNNVKAGEAAGKAAALLRPAGGKVVVFVGTFQAANARERRDGFLAGAGKAFTLGEGQSWEDGGDLTKARTNVQSAITKTPDLGILLGLWSYNAPAIAQEVKATPEVRKKATVVTFDLDESAVAHIEQGNIDVSVCQNPYEMGYQGVRLLKALIQKDEKEIKGILPDGKTLDTGVRVIVPRADSPVKAMGKSVITIDEMKIWLTSKGLKSS